MIINTLVHLKSEQYSREILVDSSEETEANGVLAIVTKNSQHETESLIDLASDNSAVKGLIAWTDLMADDLPETLDHYRTFPLIKGFTHLMQIDNRSSLLQNPGFIRGIKVLKVYNFSFDLLIPSEDLKELTIFVDKLPGVKIAITQNGLDFTNPPGIKKKWENEISELAYSPDLVFKVPGVSQTLSNGQKYPDQEYYIDKLLELVGPDRIMFGSSSQAEDKESTLSRSEFSLSLHLERYGKEISDKILYKNAIKFYNLSL